MLKMLLMWVALMEILLLLLLLLLRMLLLLLISGTFLCLLQALSAHLQHHLLERIPVLFRELLARDLLAFEVRLEELPHLCMRDGKRVLLRTLLRGLTSLSVARRLLLLLLRSMHAWMHVCGSLRARGGLPAYTLRMHHRRCSGAVHVRGESLHELHLVLRTLRPLLGAVNCTCRSLHITCVCGC